MATVSASTAFHLGAGRREDFLELKQPGFGGATCALTTVSSRCTLHVTAYISSHTRMPSPGPCFQINTATRCTYVETGWITILNSTSMSSDRPVLVLSFFLLIPSKFGYYVPTDRAGVDV